MSKTEIMNGRIIGARLGEEHGCLTADLVIEGDGWSCGFGGYKLACWFGTNKPTHGARAIVKLLRTLDIKEWEQLHGTYVRVKYDEICKGEITTIGHIYKERWFSFKEFFEKCKEE